MQVDGSPLSGLANNRQLADEDLIRAIRIAATGEYEATQSYIQIFETIDHKLAAKVLQSVANMKREHMGDFIRSPYEIAPDEENR